MEEFPCPHGHDTRADCIWVGGKCEEESIKQAIKRERVNALLEVEHSRSDYCSCVMQDYSRPEQHYRCDVCDFLDEVVMPKIKAERDAEA